MQSIQIDKLCKECSKSFIAKRTHTQYCSHKCSSRAYKARKRNAKIDRVEESIRQSANLERIKKLKYKEILNITETALYIGVSRPTIYTYLKNEELKSMRLGNKTFIKKTDIDALFNYKYEVDIPITSVNESEEITEFYTIAEIKEKFNIKESWIYKIIRENHIPKTLYRGKSHISKRHIDNYFRKNSIESDKNITKWYSTEDIIQKYGMTDTAVYSFVYENNIPKKRKGRKTLYSQLDFDEARGNNEVLYNC